MDVLCNLTMYGFVLARDVFPQIGGYSFYHGEERSKSLN